MMRVNEDGKDFCLRNFWENTWERLSDRTFISRGMLITASQGGKRIDVGTVCATNQTILLADMQTGSIVGRIEITAEGALSFHDGMPAVNVANRLPWFWHAAASIVLGIDGPASMNIRDVLGDDEDMFRLKKGHKSWFVPNAYRKPTRDYDVDFFDQPNPHTVEEAEPKSGPSNAEKPEKTEEQTDNAEKEPEATTSTADQPPAAIEASETPGESELRLPSDDDSDDEYGSVVSQIPALVKKETPKGG